MPIDYSRGKIYQIRSHQTDLVYVGSTCEPTLARRLYKHRHDYRSWKERKKRYVTSFKILEYEDHYIELIEEYPCENREQLRRKEGQYIRKLNCINRRVAGRTNKEYRVDNKEKIAKKKKEYRENNKEKLAKQKKEWHENNKEKIAKKKKIYRENNKEKLAKKDKEKYQKNKEKISKKNKEKVECPCGSIVTRGALYNHKRSKKHKKWEESQNQE